MSSCKRFVIVCHGSLSLITDAVSSMGRTARSTYAKSQHGDFPAWDASDQIRADPGHIVSTPEDETGLLFFSASWV